jgi:hypothetical protein
LQKRESIPPKEFRHRVEQLLRQAISNDYVDIFLERDIRYGYTTFEWIKDNVEETSGWEESGTYNDDDIRLAVGRVLGEYFFPLEWTF